MTENRPATISYIRAFRPLVPSESMVAFLKHASKQLETFDFENDDPLLDPRIYALNSLRITLFERSAAADQNASDQLNKLHVVMAQPKITTTERRRSRPGVFETITKRQPNPLIRALIDVEELYLQDGEEEGGKPKLVVRASTIVDSTEEDYRTGGTELSLVLDEGAGSSVLGAQRDILEEKARGLNATRGLTVPRHMTQPLRIPFMVAPFDSEGQRDEFVDDLTTTAEAQLPVYGNGAGPIQWQLKT